MPFEKLKSPSAGSVKFTVSLSLRRLSGLEYLASVRYARSIGSNKPYLGQRDDFWLDICNDVMMFFSVQDRVDIIFNELKKYKEEEEKE